MFYFYPIQFEHTALIHAAEAGHTECVRLLVEAGANMEIAASVRFDIQRVLFIDNRCVLLV
jgi:ankyrin repeat protein